MPTNNRGKMMELDCRLAAIQEVITQSRHKLKPVGERLIRKRHLYNLKVPRSKYSVLQRGKSNFTVEKADR